MPNRTYTQRPENVSCKVTNSTTVNQVTDSITTSIRLHFVAINSYPSYDIVLFCFFVLMFCEVPKYMKLGTGHSFGHTRNFLLTQQHTNNWFKYNSMHKNLYVQIQLFCCRHAHSYRIMRYYKFSRSNAKIHRKPFELMQNVNCILRFLDVIGINFC